MNLRYFLYSSNKELNILPDDLIQKLSKYQLQCYIIYLLLLYYGDNFKYEENFRIYIQKLISELDSHKDTKENNIENES